MNWILIIMIGSGWGTLSDLKTLENLTEAQCKAFVREAYEIGGMGGICFGPKGETFSTKTIKAEAEAKR